LRPPSGFPFLLFGGFGGALIGLLLLAPHRFYFAFESGHIIPPFAVHS